MRTCEWVCEWWWIWVRIYIYIAMWTIHGKQYNLTRFMDEHPGGREILELTKGMDCTAIFDSYHIQNSDMVRKTLKLYGDGTDLPEQAKFYKEVSGYLDMSSIKLRDLKTSMGTLVFLNGMCLLATIVSYKYDMWILGGYYMHCLVFG